MLDRGHEGYHHFACQPGLSPRKTFVRSEWLAAEEIDELYDQDDDHGQLKKEGAALVELVDHEAVELFGGADLLGYQVLVVGHADLGGGELVKTRREHVAEKLDGVVGVFGELGDVEKHGMKAGGGASEPPAGEDAGAFVEQGIDALQLIGEEIVVVAEFEELRVGVLEELNGSIGAGGGVVEEGCVPADDGEVVGVVGDTGLEDLVALDRKSVV